MNSIVADVYSAVLRNELHRGSDNGAGGDFWNYGLWNDQTTSQQQASEQLVEYLLAKIPAHASRVLDVAFGKGESTRRLCRIFGDQGVVGINIAADQVQAARQRGVNCELRAMDAGRMQFKSGSFDAILCIEAAFHFHTRARFLRRAYCALRPGGRLVMSDVLFRAGHGLPAEVFPLENQVSSLESYHSLLLNAGFEADSVAVERTTERQIVPYFAHVARAMRMLPPQAVSTVGTTLSPADMSRLGFMLLRLLNVADCVVVTADKR